MKVSIYGAGYVGLVTAVCLAELGHDVLCMDVVAEKIDRLNQGILPIYEEGLEELLHRNQAIHRIQFTHDSEEAVLFGDIQMIAVGTPSKQDGSVNLDYIDASARAIGQYRRTPCLVVNKSTVPPGTADRVANIIQKTAAEFGGVSPITMVSNPEFLQEGTAVRQCMNPDRILIGTQSPDAAEVMRHLYAPLLLNRPELFVVMSVRSAELAKYAANALLATKISFINEISQIAERVGADVQEVKRGLALDYRINPAFLNAGCGFGGSCFPKDLAGLEHIAQSNQFEPHLISAVLERNREQQMVLFEKLSTYFNGQLKHKTIAIWGLAFKPHTDDIRSASSQVLIDSLLEHDVIIQAYDPLAMQAMAKLYAAHLKQLHFSESALAALHHADALVVVTEWPEFNTIAPEDIRKALKNPAIIDGRNIFDPEEMIQAGFYYTGVGRAAQTIKKEIKETA